MELLDKSVPALVPPDIPAPSPELAPQVLVRCRFSLTGTGTVTFRQVPAPVLLVESDRYRHRRRHLQTGTGTSTSTSGAGWVCLTGSTGTFKPVPAPAPQVLVDSDRHWHRHYMPNRYQAPLLYPYQVLKRRLQRQWNGSLNASFKWILFFDIKSNIIN